MTSLFKQRFIEMTGKEIPLDFFLYSCLEAEKMLAAAEKRAGGPEQVECRYLDAALAEGLTATDVGAWEQAIGTLYAWHCKREPALTESSMVDIQALCPVTTEFAAFHADLRHLYHSVTSENLPLFNKEAGLAPVWTAVTKVIDHKSSFAAGLFEEFFAWTYNNWEAPVYEVGSRPPVGRYAPPPRLRTGGPGSVGGSHGGRPERNDRPERSERPERNDRPEPGNRAQGERPQRDGNRPQHDSRPQRDGNRPQHSDRPRRDDQPRQHDDERSIQQEKEALAEVEKAIATLASNPSTEFVDLPPTNSFQRRKQHHETNERGFRTQSVGEGHDRAVRVSRGTQG